MSSAITFGSHSSSHTKNYSGSAVSGSSSGIDWWFLGCAMLLLCIGLIMIFSSSGIIGAARYNDKYYFFKKQLIFTAAGLIGLAACAAVPRGFLNRLQYVILFGALALLALTITPFGKNVNGASRWLVIGPFSLQPMEFAKIALVLYLGFFMSTKQSIIKTFSRGIIPPFAVTGAFCCILLLQPDFGGAVALALLLFMMCFVGGTRIIYLVISAMLALGAGVLLILMEPYRYQRLMGHLNTSGDLTGTGYQLMQAFYAMGMGGFFGVGLGSGTGKLMFLPEGHTDFILPLISEEIGFVGVSFILIIMALLIWRGLRIAVQQVNLRDRFTAFGLIIILASSMVLNMAVVTGSVPPKGVPMPFFSYGGSSLLTSLFCVGLLLNYSRSRQEK